jgi:hypothetical protein
MKVKTLPLSAALFCGTMAIAGDFGTSEEARRITSQLTEIVSGGGIDAGIAAMHDPSYPFFSSTMGVHLSEQGIIVGNNREAGLLAASYEDVADLTVAPMWPRFMAAADAILEWHHYDTEQEYTYA